MSTSKYAKMNKRNHRGRSKEFGKAGTKLKGFSFYNGSNRQKLKKLIED